MLLVGAVGAYYYFVYAPSQVSNTSNTTNGGLAIGGQDVQNNIAQGGSTVTATATQFVPTTVVVTTTSFSTTTQTITTTQTQIVTAPPPAFYAAIGTVTMGVGYNPSTITFTCTGLNAITNNVNSTGWYQAPQVPNSTYCSVSVHWNSSSVPPFNGVSTCNGASFDQTVGAGSSPVRMDWGC